jgi:hypothetical protein
MYWNPAYIHLIHIGKSNKWLIYIVLQGVAKNPKTIEINELLDLNASAGADPGGSNVAWDSVRFLRSSYSLNWSIRTEAIVIYTYKRPKHYNFEQIYTPGPALRFTAFFPTKSRNKNVNISKDVIPVLWN